MFAEVPSISDYAAIGNMRSVALVSRSGSIDWLCLPDLDDPSVFGALLDQEKGGCFKISPACLDGSDQSYLPETNVLLTRLRSGSGGEGELFDFMPIQSHHTDAPLKHRPANPILYRILKHGGPATEYVIQWSPRFDYGRTRSRIARTGFGITARSETGESLSLTTPLMDPKLEEKEGGMQAEGRIRLRDGDRIVFQQLWSQVPSSRVSLDEAYDALSETSQAWRSWLSKSDLIDRDWTDRAYRDLLIRSELALKLLTHSATGAIAAAPTTSLPEVIGGVRNWDYRYGWIRDASLTAQALATIGHTDEAKAFLRWVEEVSFLSSKESDLRIMYGLHGRRDLEEEILPHWEGYRGSRPVRIGNEAFRQSQLDIYGEILNTAYELVRNGEELRPAMMEFLWKVTDRAYRSWDQKDHGVWEFRGPRRAFVHSKMMLWTALDRAVLIAVRNRISDDVQGWQHRRDRIFSDILRFGFNRELRSFVQSYGSSDLDASALLIPIQELLPASHPMVQGTIDAIESNLMENGLVYRYRMDDGLPGVEGAFVPCTFWLVDVLALSGRLDEAYGIFEGLARRSNHAGLYSEEIDPVTGEFLGNFPQAFSHIGLINSLLYLAHAEKRKTPVVAPIGSVEHRRAIVSMHPDLVRRAA